MFSLNFELVRNEKDLAKNREGVPFHPEGLKCLINSWYENLKQGCWSNWQVIFNFILIFGSEF